MNELQEFVADGEHLRTVYLDDVDVSDDCIRMRAHPMAGVETQGEVTLIVYDENNLPEVEYDDAGGFVGAKTETRHGRVRWEYR